MAAHHCRLCGTEQAAVASSDDGAASRCSKLEADLAVMKARAEAAEAHAAEFEALLTAPPAAEPDEEPKASKKKS